MAYMIYFPVLISLTLVQLISLDMELNSVESTPNYSKFIKFITHCYTQCTVKLPSLKLRFFIFSCTLLRFFLKL